MISIIHPSRGRPLQSFNNIQRWIQRAASNDFEIIVSLDEDDPCLGQYHALYESSQEVSNKCLTFVNQNKSSVEAINRAAAVSKANILIVVADDQECFPDWDTALLKEVEGKTDWILKTQDGIQDWIITMPVMDRAYYNRFGYIYDPDFLHMFCDTWLTVQADISGRKITSDLKFPHLNGSIQDELRKRCDATWVQGEKTFIQKVKSTPVEYLNKITDRGMKNWIRNKTGIRV